MTQMLLTGLSFMSELQIKVLDHEKQILEQWRQSKNLPRRKKKQMRKRLQVEYSICMWSKQILRIK